MTARLARGKRRTSDTDPQYDPNRTHDNAFHATEPPAWVLLHRPREQELSRLDRGAWSSSAVCVCRDGEQTLEQRYPWLVVDDWRRASA
jgi:hypothetical protein